MGASHHRPIEDVVSKDLAFKKWAKGTASLGPRKIAQTSRAQGGEAAGRLEGDRRAVGGRPPGGWRVTTGRLEGDHRAVGG